MVGKNSLDLLRLVAATFVLFSHQYALLGQPESSFFGWISFGGAGGGTIFFFLSGVLVWSSWARDPDRGAFFCAARATAAFRATLREKILPIFMHDAWIAFVVASCARIVVVDVPLIMYRQHGGNVIGGRRRRRDLLWEIKQAQKMSPDRFQIEILQSLEMMRKCQEMTNSKMTPSNLSEIREEIEHLQARQGIFHCNILRELK